MQCKSDRWYLDSYVDIFSALPWAGPTNVAHVRTLILQCQERVDFVGDSRPYSLPKEYFLKVFSRVFLTPVYKNQHSKFEFEFDARGQEKTTFVSCIALEQANEGDFSNTYQEYRYGTAWSSLRK